jgi:hypothetical protein
MNNAQPNSSSAAASTNGAASSSLELLEARHLRDALKQLLRREQAAMAEFLVALADFDRRGSWEPLGHANLFALLVAELLPRPVPSTRMVVTQVPDRTVASLAVAALGFTASAIAPPQPLTLALSTGSAPSPSATSADPNVAPPWRFPTSGIAFGGGAVEHGGRAPLRDEIVPLTAKVRSSTSASTSRWCGS